MALLLSSVGPPSLEELEPRNGIAPWREQPQPRYQPPPPSPEQQAKVDRERAERERLVREASPAWQRAEARRLKKGAALAKGRRER